MKIAADIQTIFEIAFKYQYKNQSVGVEFQNVGYVVEKMPKLLVE
jgi:hypothetical protein